MKIETAVQNSPPQPVSAPKSQTPSANFQDLMKDSSPSVSISREPTEAEKKAKEEALKLEILTKVMQNFIGTQPVLSKDDIINISGENTDTMSVTLSDAGFDKLKGNLEKGLKLSDNSTISISPDLIQISAKSNPKPQTPQAATPTEPIKVVDESTKPKTTSIPVKSVDTPPKKIDPIVLSFGKQSASLRGDNLNFDIDGDGTLDNMAVLGKNDFLLVLDKNRNGTIDNGKELFGPLSGNGFLELRLMDSNRDNKLDKSDKDFVNLQLLEFSHTKQQMLSSLSSKGVESIYLSTVKTAVGLTDANGTIRAQITERSSLKLNDNSAGVVQHLDFFT